MSCLNRLAFSNLGCPQWSIERTVAQARRLGYGAIELRLLDGEIIDPVRDCDALRDAVTLCRAGDVAVCAFDTSCRFNLSGDERARQLTELSRWIEHAHQLGVPVLRVFGGEARAGSSQDDAVARVADALTAAASEADQAGVTLALETHDAFASARRVAQVLALVPSPAVAALWDSHHPYRMGESVEEVGELLRGRLAHVHIKDARRLEDGGWELVLLGAGEVPVEQQLRVLDRIGYTGFISVEWERKWHAELAEPEIALPQHILQLRRWQEFTTMRP